MFKNSLNKRSDNDGNKGEYHIQWSTYITETVSTYNNKLRRSSHGFTPSEALEYQGYVDVRINLEMKATRTRRYPEFDVDDNVKINKRNDKLNKERINVWSDKTYTIERISVSHCQKFYNLNC